MKDINGSFRVIFIFSTNDWCVMSMAKRLVRIEDDRNRECQDVKEDEKLAMIERRRASDNASVESVNQSETDGTRT